MRTSLFAALNLGREAIASYQYALDIVGQDIVNVGTPGHARRTPVLESQSLQLGGGVRVVGFTSARNEHLEQAYRSELSGYAAADATASSLALLDGYFGDPLSPGLTDSMQRVYDSLASATVNGLNEVSRQEVIASLDGWAASMRDAAETVQREQVRANETIRGEVRETNEILERVAQLNRAIAEVADPQAKVPLLDQLTAVLANLAEHVDFVTREAEGGGRVVSLTSGAPLVSDRDAFQLEARPNAANGGLDDIYVRGVTGSARNITTLPIGGAIGGYLTARDGVLRETLATLDQIAITVVARFDAVHQAGYDANGSPGGALFEALPGGATGQAKALQVSAALRADTRLLALAGAPGGGDLGNAGLLWDTRDALILDGGRTRVIDGLAKVGQQVGYAISDSQTARDLRSVLRDQAVGERDRLSATNLESSIVDLVSYQRGMQAAMGFMRQVDDMLEELLNMFR